MSVRETINGHIERQLERLEPLGPRQREVLRALLRQIHQKEGESNVSEHNGPKSYEHIGDLVIVMDEGDVQVNYTEFLDGRLWEVNWKVGTNGTVVRRAVGYVPKVAVPDGLGLMTEDDRTYDGYWQAAA